MVCNLVSVVSSFTLDYRLLHYVGENIHKITPSCLWWKCVYFTKIRFSLCEQWISGLGSDKFQTLPRGLTVGFVLTNKDLLVKLQGYIT